MSMYKSNASGKHEQEGRGQREHRLQKKQRKSVSLGGYDQIPLGQKKLAGSHVVSPSHLGIRRGPQAMSETSLCPV